MSKELNTLANKKWVQNFSGLAPTLDTNSGVDVGDSAYDTSLTPNSRWSCVSNASGAPIWVRTDSDEVTITKTSHGLTSGSVNKPIKKSATGFGLAAADTLADADVAGLLDYVIDANNFVLVTSGKYFWYNHGYTANSELFLSTVAGNLTTTAPTGAGAVYKKVAYVLDANNVLVETSPAYVIGSGSQPVSGAYLQIANNLSDVQSVSAARSHLGLGTAAVLNVGTNANNVVQLSSLSKLPAVDGSQLTNMTKSQVGLSNVTNNAQLTTSQLVTSVGNPGSDSNVPSEKAVNTALMGYVPTTRQVNGHVLGTDITISKSDVGLGNVQNVDTTNASNISSGVLNRSRLPYLDEGNVAYFPTNYSAATASVSGNLDGINTALYFNGNRTVKRSGLPAVNVDTTTVKTFIESYFFPFIPATMSLNGFSYQENGTDPTPQLVGTLTLNDETTVNSRTVLVNGSPNGTFATNNINQAAPAAITSNTTYQLDANVANNGSPTNIFSATQTVSFIYPFLYGTNASGSLSGTALYNGLTKNVTSKQNLSVNMTGTNVYMYFCYPTSYGSLSQILDPNMFDITGSFTQTTVSVTSTGLFSNYTTNFYVYTSGLTTVSGGTFQFKF